jgi:hypothetical protein
MKPIHRKKKCKTCGNWFMPFRTTQRTCSLKCAIDDAKVLGAKKTKVQHRKDKERVKTRSQWMKEAQAAFNKYIRERDAGERCISCGRNHSGQYHAGHYRSVGAAPELRFNELNCSKQCAPCNNHKSGDLINYRINLIDKIGIKRVEWLEGPHEAKHYSIDDLKAIKAEYQAKLKEMALADG